MGSGLAAVGDQKTAEKLAADWGGRTLRFSELAAYFVEKEQTRDD
jgi:nitrous oxide reductase accessory protein NosL